MKYTEWLSTIGYKVEETGISEEEAIKNAAPLENPGTEKMKLIKRIVIHHSATESGNAACFRVLHRLINRWNDVGYHFVVGNGSFGNDGLVEDGRNLPYQGAHAKGANEDSIGVCLVGNFNKTNPTKAQLNSLQLLLQQLTAKYSIQKDSITLHRFVNGSSTECPGKNFTMKTLGYLLES